MPATAACVGFTGGVYGINVSSRRPLLEMLRSSVALRTSCSKCRPGALRQLSSASGTEQWRLKFKAKRADSGLGTAEAVEPFRPAAEAGRLNKYSSVITQQQRQGAGQAQAGYLFVAPTAGVLVDK